MEALAHFLPKKKSSYDLISLKRMKKLGETMVWKVVFYGRCNSRTKPAMAAPICDVYNAGDFVEVFDFTDGNSKWLKIKGHEKGHAPVSWILAMDPFCNQDLVVRATNTEAKRAREFWGQRPRREFDRSPPRKVEAPPTPAADGQGPATQPPPVPTHENHPLIIDPEMFKQATRSPGSPPRTLDEREIACLENVTRLRDLRLRDLKRGFRGLPEADRNLTPDGSRDDWKRGTKISVWSQSDQTFYLGIVVSIQEEGGLFEKLEVHYKKGGQRHKKFIPKYSKQLKARTSRASRNKETDPGSDNSLEDADIPKVESPPSKNQNASRLADGWTEHFDKRTSRYYYNNKADGKTLWDKEAFKQGIIPEIKTRSATK